MAMAASYLKLAGFTDDDVEKRRVPRVVESVSNGFVVEANRYFESNRDFVAYLTKITGNTDFKNCNQKSLRKKISDMIATAKKRRKNKDKRLHAYLSTEFKAPVRSEPRTTPSLSSLLRENESLKRKVNEQESALEELQAKYDDAIHKLKKVCH